MPVAYTTHNRILTVALSGDIDHHRVKGLLREVEGEIDQVLPRQLPDQPARVLRAAGLQRLIPLT